MVGGRVALVDTFTRNELCGPFHPEFYLGAGVRKNNKLSVVGSSPEEFHLIESQHRRNTLVTMREN